MRIQGIDGRTTAAGRALLPAAREALMTLRAARHELQDVIDPDKGLVALGFLHTLGTEIVPQLLKDFRHGLGHEDVPGVANVHHPLGHVDAAPNHVYFLFDVGVATDRAGVYTHAQLDIGSILESRGNFRGTLNRGGRVTKEHERHSVA